MKKEAVYPFEALNLWLDKQRTNMNASWEMYKVELYTVIGVSSKAARTLNGAGGAGGARSVLALAPAGMYLLMLNTARTTKAVLLDAVDRDGF